MSLRFLCSLSLVATAGCSGDADLIRTMAELHGSVSFKHSSTAFINDTAAYFTDVPFRGVGCLTAEERELLRAGLTSVEGFISEQDRLVEDSAEMLVLHQAAEDLRQICLEDCPTCTAVRHSIHDTLQMHGFSADTLLRPPPPEGYHLSAEGAVLVIGLRTLQQAVAFCIGHHTLKLTPLSEEPPIGGLFTHASAGLQGVSGSRDRRYTSGTPSPGPTPPPTRGPGATQNTTTHFMVVGDWGYSHSCHGNVKPGGQQAVASMMQQQQQQLGGNVKFVINVGDSFYCSGVNGKEDSRWSTVWADVYDMPGTVWYSIYGNHDYGSEDPCATSDKGPCHQIAKHASIMNGMTWYLPALNYVVSEPVPGANLGIIAVDTNVAWRDEICKYVYGDCYNSLQRRYESGQKLLDQTIDKAINGNFSKNIIVFSHYPTDYCGGGLPEAFCDSLKRGAAAGLSIFYFAGHRHANDASSVDAWKVGDAKSYLVGGGGGFSCDASPNGQYENQGFMVGDIATNGAISNVRFVNTPRNQICYSKS